MSANNAAVSLPFSHLHPPPPHPRGPCVFWEGGHPGRHAGSTLESFLREDGSYEEAKTEAIKAVLAYKLEEAMKAQRLSKARMAARMETSRSQLDRVLDPDNEGVTLDTLKHAAAAVGMLLVRELRQKRVEY